MIQQIGSGYNLHTPQLYPKTCPTSFRQCANTQTTNIFERNPKQDTVIVQKPNKKASKAKKLTIGIGVGLAGIATATVLYFTHQGNKISKLYKEKLIPSNLADHINFKEATTKEEGIKFAKEVLGIKEVDPDFTLEAINWTNKGLVDVSNAHKGKAYMPSALRYNKQEGSLAYTNIDISDKAFGELGINRDMFDTDYLNKYIAKRLGLNKNVKDKAAEKATKEFSEKAPEKKVSDYLKISWSKEFKEMVNKFKNNPEEMSILEKRELLHVYEETNRVFQGIINNPADFINACKNGSFKDLNIKYQELNKLSTEEQRKKLINLLEERQNKTKTTLVMPSQKASTYNTIYHEMGHLQDYGKNLKELHIKEVNPFKANPKDAVDPLTNRWGGTTYGDGYFKKLLAEKPDDFKLLYPDMYEHLTNQQIQQTTGKVSNYAQTGIGEFVAETYAQMISGKRISDDVMTLYKKYNGPMPV